MPGENALTERGRDFHIISVGLVARPESDADFLTDQPFGGRAARHFTKNRIRLDDAPIHIADDDDIAHGLLDLGNQRSVLSLA